MLEARRGTAIALDRVRNPYNIGAILRSAAFFGVDGALLGAPAPHPRLDSDRRARSRRGAEHLALARTTNLADTLARLRARGVRSVGADGHADAGTLSRSPSGAPPCSSWATSARASVLASARSVTPSWPSAARADSSRSTSASRPACSWPTSFAARERGFRDFIPRRSAVHAPSHALFSEEPPRPPQRVRVPMIRSRLACVALLLSSATLVGRAPRIRSRRRIRTRIRSSRRLFARSARRP